MALSEILASLSLLGYGFLLGQAFWKTWLMGKDDWGFDDHGFDNLPEVINWALKHCLNQGFIVIQVRNSEHFVQFRKYILRNGEYGLELGFPEAHWSKACFPKLRDALTADGVPFREAREIDAEVNAFIHVDCGRDIDQAVDLVHRCFFDIYGLAPDIRFESGSSNYSRLRDVVVDPDYENPSLREIWPAIRAKSRAEGSADPNLLMRMAAYTVGLVFCCYPALWVAWYFTDPSSPDWQWSVGPIHLAGNHSTLVLLPIFYLLLAGFTRTRREFPRVSNLRPSTHIDRIGAPLVNVGLPMAVITSWPGL